MILVHGKVSVGIYTHDLLNGANNKNGVYSIELIVDGKQIYFHEMNEFGFHELTLLIAILTMPKNNSVKSEYILVT